MLAYWGRNGALSKFTLDLAHAARAFGIPFSISHSTSNELSEAFGAFAEQSFPVPTFTNSPLAAFRPKPIIELRRRLEARLRHDRSRAFVSLMPHPWSPIVAPAVRRAGARHIVVVHDADPHPGDRTGLLTRWLLREAAMADRVITLSEYVAHRLVDRGFSPNKISVLFHPDLDYALGCGMPNELRPLRVLFLGRILAYKGLELFVDAVETVRRRGVALDVGVYGRGEIVPTLRHRLTALGAAIDNRWQSHDELAKVLASHDVVVTPCIEASQSGVIAAAFGAGLPVIATPVGGLTEQVTDGVTGFVAKAVSSEAVAAEIEKIARASGLLERLREGVATTRNQRSMARFINEVSRIALS